MITALNKEESLSILTKKEEKDRNRAPRVQRIAVKHAHFPLNLLKDYVYVPPKDEEHPRLFVTPDQVRQFRKTFQADPAKLAQLTTTPVNLYAMEDWITYYLGTGDAALGKHLSATAVQTMQRTVDTFLDQDYPPVFGLGNSNDDVFQAANLSDAILDDAQLSPELRHAPAQITWLAYTVNRDDYWSPEPRVCGESEHDDESRRLPNDPGVPHPVAPAGPDLGRSRDEGVERQAARHLVGRERRLARSTALRHAFV